MMPATDTASRRRSLLSNELAPEVLATIPAIFKNAVLDTVKSGLHLGYSGQLLTTLRGIDLSQRFIVFHTLDSLYGESAIDIERAIDRRFRSDVMELLGRASAPKALLNLVVA
jgi:hypothetical protein